MDLKFEVFFFRHKRVAFLDTDVGQPEFTPPGCLSLTLLDSESIGIFFKNPYNAVSISLNVTFSAL